MAPQHCPYCNEKETRGMGSVAYSVNVLVEYHCSQCGCLFYITDRRNIQQRKSKVSDSDMESFASTEENLILLMSERDTSRLIN
jgi:predicted secreted acid phosphatase